MVRRRASLVPPSLFESSTFTDLFPLLHLQLEFDTPKALLSNPKGELTKLVDASSDADELRSIANGL